MPITQINERERERVNRAVDCECWKRLSVHGPTHEANCGPSQRLRRTAATPSHHDLPDHTEK